ncbi:hypothetical protein BV898_03491 [Hypsibius exemplaris]|uniref:Putative auto-transporter adhesin head GIN domain-containing protein n=1 Tax=Hypsibius exemplaris TaxID=2072580 RepID=A0A1W0X560_HYPEX|nr:hypothetical protein BV898_03491 [Hypsibius exemplaris]
MTAVKEHEDQEEQPATTGVKHQHNTSHSSASGRDVQTACTSSAPINAAPTTTETYTEHREVSGFTGISSSSFFVVSVAVASSNTEAVRIEAEDPGVCDQIETVVEDATLHIRFVPDHEIHINGTVSVHVDAIAVSRLEAGGTSTIRVVQPLEEPKLRIVTSGAGKVFLQATTDALDVESNGSSAVSVSGTATASSIAVSDGAVFLGEGLVSEATVVSVAGVAKAAVQVTRSLTGRAQAAGQVLVYGAAPAFLDVKTSDVAKVVSA